MTDFIQLLSLTLIGSVLGLIGGVLFIFNKRFAGVLEKNAIPFAAGVLLTFVFLGLLPESVELLNETTFLIVLTAFFGAYLFELLSVGIYHHHSEEDTSAHSELYSPAILVTVGDTIHNFIDGVAIGAAFMVSPPLGLVAAISTFFHEIPHEIGDFGILLKAGWSRKKILVVNIFSALSTILGALFVAYFAINEQLLGVMLGISAGFFLYLGAVDFLPHTSAGFKNNSRILIPLILGILLMAVIFWLLP